MFNEVQSKLFTLCSVIRFDKATFVLRGLKTINIHIVILGYDTV
jgi:hypothetical protein